MAWYSLQVARHQRVIVMVYILFKASLLAFCGMVCYQTKKALYLCVDLLKYVCCVLYLLQEMIVVEIPIPLCL